MTRTAPSRQRSETGGSRLRAPWLAALLILVLGACGQQGEPPATEAAASATLVAPAAQVPTTPPTANSAGSVEALLGEAGATARSYGLRIVWAVVLLMATFWTVQFVLYVLNSLAERNAERRLFYKRLVPIVRIAVWSLAVVFIVRVVLGVEAQGLFAAAAAVGVAIGFAAQDILKNIFGGLVIVFDQPFQVGDKIKVGSSYGEVVSIGLRSTRIVTPDDNLVSVPNSQIMDGQVANANAGALDCQVVTDLYLPGWVDEGLAKRIAYQAAASAKLVYTGKPIVVLCKDEFKETFILHLKVKAYVLDARYEFAFMSEVTERARAEFRRQGLLGPLHGARAYVDITPLGQRASTDGGEKNTDANAATRPVEDRS